MPIVAVNDISKEDLEVIFRQEQSELMDSSTGRKSKFVKKKGAESTSNKIKAFDSLSQSSNPGDINLLGSNISLAALAKWKLAEDKKLVPRTKMPKTNVDSLSLRSSAEF